jgi:type II secretory pathway pseudopilin PulG
LLELLVVIVIIGLLATIGLPAIRGMTKSNAIAAADRQLLDDLAYARQRAIGDHTSVYVVFIPPNIVNYASVAIPTPDTGGYAHNLITNLYTGQYSTYALVTLRSVGDQPGNATPHYLTSWRSLPGGVYIATNKFVPNPSLSSQVPTFFYSANLSQLAGAFPFPMATNQYLANLPHFGFNYLGQLIYRSNNMDNLVINLTGTQGSASHMYIPLARGSILYVDDGTGTGGLTADVAEAHVGDAYYSFTPASQTDMGINTNLPSPDDGKYYNQIYVDPLTGRARVERLDVQ